MGSPTITPRSILTQCAHLPFLSQGRYSLATLEQFQEAIIEEDIFEKQLPPPTKTIAELAIATPQLSTLLAAVKAADLVETLSEKALSLSLLLPMMLLLRFL